MSSHMDDRDRKYFDARRRELEDEYRPYREVLDPNKSLEAERVKEAMAKQAARIEDLERDLYAERTLVERLQKDRAVQQEAFESVRDELTRVHRKLELAEAEADAAKDSEATATRMYRSTDKQLQAWRCWARTNFPNVKLDDDGDENARVRLSQRLETMRADMEDRVARKQISVAPAIALSLSESSELLELFRKLHELFGVDSNFETAE